jgi:AAA+ ATPase superfamily predicted ATPase
LLDLHILLKEYPYGVETERKSIYVLRDNMFRFWYRFIPQNVTAIESGLGMQVYEKRILSSLPAYVGRVFEDACREYMKRQNGRQSLPFMFDGIGRWWGTNPMTKAQEEVDILADAGNEAVFGECKWSAAEIGMDVLADLKRKSMMFKRYEDKHYVLFSKAGFHRSIMDDTSSNGVKLVGLQELYD